MDRSEAARLIDDARDIGRQLHAPALSRTRPSSSGAPTSSSTASGDLSAVHQERRVVEGSSYGGVDGGHPGDDNHHHPHRGTQGASGRARRGPRDHRIDPRGAVGQRPRLPTGLHPHDEHVGLRITAHPRRPWATYPLVPAREEQEPCVAPLRRSSASASSCSSMPSASATFPGGNGKIAYLDDKRIHVIDPDGSGHMQLTFGDRRRTPTFAQDPARPPGRRSGLVARRLPDHLRAQGCRDAGIDRRVPGQQRWHRSGPAHGHPRPMGVLAGVLAGRTRIAFIDGTGRSDIFVMSTAGTDVVRVIDEHVTGLLAELAAHVGNVPSEARRRSSSRSRPADRGTPRPRRRRPSGCWSGGSHTSRAPGSSPRSC